MRSMIFRHVLATVVLSAACSSPDAVAPRAIPGPAIRAASADAEGVATISRTIDQYVWVSCVNGGAGEAVRVTGELRYDLHRTTDSSGVLHLNIKSNTLGLTAVGLTTGARFRGVMTERINSRSEGYMDADVRITDLVRFVALSSGDSYSLVSSSHFIVDDGNYVLWEQSWNEVCR